MRSLGVAAISLTLVTGAFAQQPTNQGPLSNGDTLGDVVKQHPNWFREPSKYKPCPADVEFADGRIGCLGCPTRCRYSVDPHR
jgi:hypothetical protein